LKGNQAICVVKHAAKKIINIGLLCRARNKCCRLPRHTVSAGQSTYKLNCRFNSLLANRYHEFCLLGCWNGPRIPLQQSLRTEKLVFALAPVPCLQLASHAMTSCSLSGAAHVFSRVNPHFIRTCCCIGQLVLRRALAPSHDVKKSYLIDKIICSPCMTGNGLSNQSALHLLFTNDI
jgi:hypothetical protein